VNEVLGDHNVDKQMTDSRGEVCKDHTSPHITILTFLQVAYLMADISNVNNSEIKDLYHKLDGLGCMIDSPLFHERVVC